MADQHKKASCLSIIRHLAVAFFLVGSWFLATLGGWSWATSTSVRAIRIAHQPLVIGVLTIGSVMILAGCWWHGYLAYRWQQLLAHLTRLAALKSDVPVRWPGHSKNSRQLLAIANQIFDNSRQLRAEEQASERSKNEMITNVSHDLRTPLTAIIGYLGLVVMGNGLPEKDQQKYLQTAYNKANHMKMLVENLFAFSQTQTAPDQLQLQTIRLNDLFAQLLASYEMDAKTHGVALTQMTKPSVIAISADSDKLARVLMNLITNALKYGKNATFVKLTARQQNNQVDIRVQNDGEPIPEAALTTIFDRFYRLEGSRNTSTGGTGLGLAIVKGIIEQHHGTVRAESNADITSFILSLPMTQEGITL